jgi:membrane-bound lytic murein transglycosylase D
MWGEDLRFLFARGVRQAPTIIAAFQREGVPPVVGLYIPVIESEYRECLESPVGAKGLFQFMAATAEGYGVPASERCNVERMAPAAAKYMKDRIAEFGTGAMSVALGIAAYNRSPDSVRRDLQTVIDSQTNERSFWTLLARRTELDHFFQQENVKYVPKFFAAAIVGETPSAFGLSMQKLSTY